MNQGQEKPDLGQRTPVRNAVENTEAVVAGHVQEMRNLGGIAFMQLRDESGILQVTLLKKELGDELFKELTSVTRESVMSFRGKVQPNDQAPGGKELLPSTHEMLSPAHTPLPMGVIDKVGVEFDTRLNNRFLDLRKDEVSAIFKLKAIAMEGIRGFLRSQYLMEVNTPKIVAQGAEGGSTLFPINYFDNEAYLAQSPQLYKQMLMACDVGGVYEIAPAYRAERSDTIRHVTEFLSLDVEMPYIDGPEPVFNAEGVVKAGLDAMKKRGSGLLEAMDVDLPEIELPLPRVTFEETKGLLKEKGKVLQPGEDLDTESEKLMGEIMLEKGHPAYFITEFPVEVKKTTFYAKRFDDRPEITTYADLDLLGQEVMSGGQREHRVPVLIEQIREAGLNPESFKHYLDPFNFGMPPHGGYGFGIERFLQKALGLSNIRETILFPRDIYRLEP